MAGSELKLAKLVANKLKLNGLKSLGSGDWGQAFLTEKNGKQIVLKITGNKREAAYSNTFIGKKYKTVANVYKVYTLVDNKISTGFFAILLEKLTVPRSLPQDLYELTKILYASSNYSSKLENFLDGYKTKGMFKIEKHIIQQIQDGWYYHAMKEWSNNKKRRMNDLYYKFIDFINYNIKNNIYSSDIHEENMGLKDNGDLAMFDLSSIHDMSYEVLKKINI